MEAHIPEGIINIGNSRYSLNCRENWTSVTATCPWFSQFCGAVFKGGRPSHKTPFLEELPSHASWTITKRPGALGSPVPELYPPFLSACVPARCSALCQGIRLVDVYTALDRSQLARFPRSPDSLRRAPFEVWTLSSVFISLTRQTSRFWFNKFLLPLSLHLTILLKSIQKALRV